MHATPGIAICCTTHSLGGIELNVLRLAAWMSARGHRCHIIGATGSPLIGKARADGIPTTEVPARSRYNVYGEARRLASTLKQNGIGTLILNINRDLLLGVLTKRATGNSVALVHTQHMQFGHAKTDFIHRWQHRQLDAWISPLPSLAEQTRTMTGVPAENIHIIPFGIELAPLLNAPSKSAARQALQLPLHAFIAGVVGRLDRGKGQEYLIRAAANLRANGRDLHVLLIGEETRGERQDYARQLRSLAETLQIADRVHFRGFIKEVATAFAAMDVFTLTSLSETYGMVTIEAMAAGCPVIATKTGGTPDLVGDGPTALLIPPSDAAALSDAIAKIMDAPELAASLGESGQAHATRHFAHDRQCESIERLIERIRR